MIGTDLVARALLIALAFPFSSLGAQETAGRPTSRALLVGCTEYRNSSISSLAGCGNDVELIRERLETVLGFRPEHVRVLTGWPDDRKARPSLSNIRAELKRLAEEARAGDRVLIFLAGHGSQQPDGNDADEDDGFDEVFLPADVRGTVKRAGREVIDKALTDDVLFDALEKLLATGAEVCLLSDSCHSGTLSRGEDEGIRGVPISTFGFERAPSSSRGAMTPSKPGDAIEGRFVGLFAVQADELAREAPLDVGGGEQRVHGIFSYSVARALSRTNGELDFDELHRRVVASYREHAYLEITPFVQGDRSMRLRTDGSAEPRDAAPTLLVLPDGDGFVVDGGSLHGLHQGAVLAVLDADRETELGRLRVVDSSMLKARCEAVGDSALQLTAPHAVRVLERPPGASPLTVFVAGEPEEAASLTASLSALDPQAARVRRGDTAAEADWQLTPPVEIGTDWTLEPLRGERGRRYTAASEALAETLLRLQRVATLMRLPGRTSGGTLPDGLEVTLLADGRPLEAGGRIRPGTELSLRARNGTATPYDVWVFWIDADHGVQRVFPDPEDADASAALTPSLESRERTATVTARSADLGLTGDMSQGVEHLLILAVPPETSALDFLESARLSPDSRGGPPEGDAAALDEAAFGPRDGSAPARGLGMDAQIGLVPFVVGWGAARPRAAFTGERVEVEPPKAAGEQLAGLPEAMRWQDALLVKHLTDVDVLADRAEAPTWLAFDFDAPELRTDPELAAGLRDRTLGLELVLWFDPASRQRVAFYDTDLAGGPRQSSPRFDLIRIDDDGDGRSEREHRFRDGAWLRDDDPATPWLRLQELDLSLLDLTDPFPVWERAFDALGATLDG